MVGTLVSLQLKLFGRGVRSNVGKLIGLIIGGLYLLGAVAGAVVGETALRGVSVGLRGAILTLGFAIVGIAWPMITLMVAGVDQTLDPGRFALLPVRARALLPGMLAASFTTLGGAATALVALGSLISWSASPATLVAAVPTVVIGSCTLVLSSRALVAVFSKAITTRKYRDVAAIALGVVALSFGVVSQFISRSIGKDPVAAVNSLQPVARVLGWTPLGWAWSIPWEVGQSQWLFAILKLVLCVALAAGLWLVWERNLDQSLVSPLESGGDGTKVKESFWVDRIVPAGPAGAVAARSLRYWRRDPRHLILLVSLVAMPFLLSAPVFINGESFSVDGQVGLGAGILVFPILGLLLMTALTVAGEINYDGSAIWSQISAGIKGRDDRWGRLVALSMLLLPLAVAMMIAFLAISKGWQYAPALVGSAAMVIGAGYGVGSLAGALWQWPTPPPGQNAFAKSSGGGVIALISTFVCMVGSAVLSTPLLVWALTSVDNPTVGWIVLPVGLVAGALLTWLGVVLGGKVLDKTWPSVLARVSKENS